MTSTLPPDKYNIVMGEHTFFDSRRLGAAFGIAAGRQVHISEIHEFFKKVAKGGVSAKSFASNMENILDSTLANFSLSGNPLPPEMEQAFEHARIRLKAAVSSTSQNGAQLSVNEAAHILGSLGYEASLVLKGEYKTLSDNAPYVRGWLEDVGVKNPSNNLALGLSWISQMSITPNGLRRPDSTLDRKFIGMENVLSYIQNGGINQVIQNPEEVANRIATRIDEEEKFIRGGLMSREQKEFFLSNVKLTQIQAKEDGTGLDDVSYKQSILGFLADACASSIEEGGQSRPSQKLIERGSKMVAGARIDDPDGQMAITLALNLRAIDIAEQQSPGFEVTPETPATKQPSGYNPK